MFENYIKLDLDEEYAIGKKNCVDAFVLLQEGAKLIFDELLSIPDETFNFNQFCCYFSKKYDVEKSIIEEDVQMVLDALNDTNSDNTLENTQVFEDNTYQFAFNYYDKKNKVFKVFFELTYGCNLKCKHCYLGTDINSYRTQITLEKAKQVIDELYQLGIVDLTFTGGELFSHPDAYAIIEYACSYNFIISILTNGTLLDDKTIETICKLPISNIRISMYGMEKYHDDFVGMGGAFNKSLHSLEYINRCRKGLGIATSVITKDNVNDLIELNSLCKRMNIEHKLSPLIYPTAKGDMGPTRLRISKEKVTQLINSQIIDITASHCSSGISRLRIAPNGEVNPCELFRNVSFGNVFRQSMKSILESENRLLWIHKIREAIKNSECSNCKKSMYCPKCIGVAYLENGTLEHKSETLCSLAEAKLQSLTC